MKSIYGRSKVRSGFHSSKAFLNVRSSSGPWWSWKHVVLSGRAWKCYHGTHVHPFSMQCCMVGEPNTDGIWVSAFLESAWNRGYKRYKTTSTYIHSSRGQRYARNHKRHFLQVLDILWHFRFLVFESCWFHFGYQSTYPCKSNQNLTNLPLPNQETKNSCQRSSSHPLWLGCMVLKNSARGGQQVQWILVVLQFTVIKSWPLPFNNTYHYMGLWIKSGLNSLLPCKPIKHHTFRNLKLRVRHTKKRLKPSSAGVT